MEWAVHVVKSHKQIAILLLSLLMSAQAMEMHSCCHDAALAHDNNGIHDSLTDHHDINAFEKQPSCDVHTQATAPSPAIKVEAKPSVSVLPAQPENNSFETYPRSDTISAAFNSKSASPQPLYLLTQRFRE